MVLWSELVADAAARLVQAGVPDGRQTAEWVAQETTGAEGAEWIKQLDEPAVARHVAGFDERIERRLSGEPLQYVLGRWSFRSLDLFIDRRVLIPRPETEIVAGFAVAEAQRCMKEQGPVFAVDLGTGSGAIGLSLATEVDDLQVWLTDNSSEALSVARANLAGVGRAGSRVTVAEGSWFDALPASLKRSVAVIASNPPYVDHKDEIEPTVVEWEPAEALYAADGGMEHLSYLISAAPQWLRPDGALVLEMDPKQMGPMVRQAKELFDDVIAQTDMTGRDRCMVARSPKLLP